MDEELVQGTEAWRLARCGSLGASQVHEALAKGQKGWLAGRDNIMAQLVAERLTGVPYETYSNADMVWGQEHEAEARAQYAFTADIDVIEVGLIRHPRIEWTHCSPDGLLGEDGLLEIKAPKSATHISTLLGAPIAGKYITQMQWQMSTTGRRWVDYCSFDPRMSPEMRLFIQRVYRNDETIIELENDVRIFLLELDKKITKLRDLYPGNVA